MSDEFVKWGAQYSGIYFDPNTKKYTTILSDLSKITFTTLEAAEQWLKEYWEIPGD